MSNTSWFSWWFTTQPAAAESAGVADPTASRVYIDELKQRLAADFRAERAECRLNINDLAQREKFNKTVVEMGSNLMKSSLESISADLADDTFDILDLRKILVIREKRRSQDLLEFFQLQSYYKEPNLL